MKLSDYVRKRNGVHLGARKSFRNMMIRSLGAGKFSKFWNYWNPIWGYYLGIYVFKPLKKNLPPALALMLTFVCCGLLHDLVIVIVRWEVKLLFTPWFLLMGICVVLGDSIRIDYSKLTWVIRAFINMAIIFSCLFIAYQVRI